MRAKRTSTPPSVFPQKALQKSRDLFERSGELTRANLDNEVDDGWRRADIVLRVVEQVSKSDLSERMFGAGG